MLVGAISASAASPEYWDATSPIFSKRREAGCCAEIEYQCRQHRLVGQRGPRIRLDQRQYCELCRNSGIVTVNTPVTAAGLTFATSGYTISGTSNLTLTSATIFLPSGGTETINCPLAGSTTVTVSPAVDVGTLILGATNIYTGATSIGSGATLTIGGTGQLNNGAYAGAITDNGTFIYNSSVAQTLSGTISGAGALTQQGSGLLTLTHANTGFTGGTTINSGSTLQLNAVSAAGSQTTITDNASLNLTAGGAATYAFSVTGGSSSVINLTMAYSAGSENLRFPGPGTLSGFGGTINLIALNSTGGTNGGTFGAGQLILSVPASILTSPGTWHLLPGATLVFQLASSSANVILDGPGNSQPYGALRLDACTQTGNVLLNAPGATIGDDNASGPSQISGNISDGGNNYGFAKAVGVPIAHCNYHHTFRANNTNTGPPRSSAAPYALCAGGLLGNCGSERTSGRKLARFQSWKHRLERGHAPILFREHERLFRAFQHQLQPGLQH